jgi:hypothetical protein
MSDYSGRLIRATEPTVSTTTASGIWTIEEALKYKQAGTWPVQVAADPNFKQTVLLLHGDGTNGAQNNTFLDSSTNNFTITRNGNTTQGTFSPFSLAAGEWSNYFDGTGDYLTAPQSTAFDLSGDFTVECWVNFNSVATTSFVGKWGGSGSYAWVLQYIVGTGLRFYTGVSGALGTSIAGAWTPVVNTWYHIAATRSSNSVRLFVDGVQVGSTTTNSDNCTTTNQALNIGRNADTNIQLLTGYISNLRILKGTAQYTSNFTPPTTPLTAITNTSLLTCLDNRFVDDSTNNFTITRNGDVRVTPFSPFAPTAEYDAGTNGGSGYFDGSGDYLSVPASSQFLPGVNTDFTFEAWVYLTATPGAQGAQIVGTGEYGTNSDWNISVNSSRVPSFYINVPPTGLSVTSSTAINLFSWNHIAVTRSGTGSNNLKMFLNGVNVGQTSTNVTLDYTGNNLTLGADENGDEALLTGYISGLRLINGTGYTSITQPTAPPTAITNTSLLLNFTNAGIIDNTGKNVLETVGNAQIDTTTKKFGTGSLEFDGTTDYIVQPTSENYGYGTGDFTIEFWLRLNATTTQTIVSNLTAANSTNPHIYINTTIRYFTANADRITGASLSTGQWYHIAVCRGSGSTRLFVDGTQSGSTYTDSNNYGATAPLGIGTYWSSGSPLTTSTLNGFIDDLRITKGVARYTANFTPPAAAFQDK